MTTSPETLVANHVPASVWRNPIHFLAFGFGSGAASVAPGTFGTLAAVPIFLLLNQLAIGSYLLVVAVLALLGVWLCHATSRDLGEHDHGGIVWDEMVGYWLTMAAAPAGWLWMAVGFALFRLFDIWKPWPIRIVDRRVHGGLGIMLDDILAAGLAWLCLQGLALWMA